LAHHYKEATIMFAWEDSQNTSCGAIIYNKRETRFLRRYLIIIVISLLAFLFVPFDALDSYRYYLYAQTISPDQTLLEFIGTKFVITFDFVYYLFFYYCNKFGLPYQLVTGLSVGLLYAQALTFIDLIQDKYEYRLTKWNDLLLRLFSLLSVSFITVFAISRNVTALMFFFFGVNNLLKGKKLNAAIFFLISCFTHVALIPYLLLFIIGAYWKGALIENINFRRILLVLVTIIGLNSSHFISLIMKPLEVIPFFQYFVYYSMHLKVDGSLNIFNFGLSKGDMLMFFTTSFVLFYGLFFVRTYNTIIVICYVMFIWLVISMGYSQMFTQRTLLILIPLQGAVSSAFLDQQNKPISILIYKSLLVFAFLAFIINVYSYRGTWIFEFPNF
jgi:hypothetical protein